MELEDVRKAAEIVLSAHEAAHATASVLLGLKFDYVTLDDPENGPHVMHVDNCLRPIPHYYGGSDCCDRFRPMCDRCRAEEQRAEAYIMTAIAGGIGVLATGCKLFGYGNDADKAFAVEFCRVAFGDSSNGEIQWRISTLAERALELLRPHAGTMSAVGRELRLRRRLTESEVKELFA